MIRVTRLNDRAIVVNADLIEFVESTPDTIISLATGRKVMVRESLDEVLERVVEYRRRTRSHPVPVAPPAPEAPARHRSRTGK